MPRPPAALMAERLRPRVRDRPPGLTQVQPPLQPLLVRPAEPELRPVLQNQQPVTGKPRLHLPHAVEVHNRRAMDPGKLRRVKTVLQLRHVSGSWSRDSIIRCLRIRMAGRWLALVRSIYLVCDPPAPCPGQRTLGNFTASSNMAGTRSLHQKGGRHDSAQQGHADTARFGVP